MNLMDAYNCHPVGEDILSNGKLAAELEVECWTAKIGFYYVYAATSLVLIPLFCRICFDIFDISRRSSIMFVLFNRCLLSVESAKRVISAACYNQAESPICHMANPHQTCHICHKCDTPSVSASSYPHAFAVYGVAFIFVIRIQTR